MLRFLALFAGALACYFALTATIQFQDPAGAAQRPILASLISASDWIRRQTTIPYQEFLTRKAAAAVGALGFDMIPSGREIRTRDGSFALSVSNGCDAIELTLLLCLAMQVCPAPAAWKLGGTLIGAGVIALLNFTRIVTLWIIGVRWNGGFDFAHFTAWPFVMLCGTGLVFTAWLKFTPLLPAKKPTTP